MSAQPPISHGVSTRLRRHTVLTYFVITYAISWIGAFLIVAPDLLRHEAIPKMDGVLMFPAMLVGPSFAGIFLTWIVDGRAGLRDLFARMGRIRIPAQWYAGLLIAPVVMLTILFCLKTFVSPVFAPNAFLIGVFFGFVAGFFEEIGWMGFVFPKILGQYSALAASTLLGVLWGVWHLPVIDYLGTATPHAPYWFRYFLAFTAAMTAMRVLIAWTYVNTKSVLLAQLMHASSTGSLVIFSPPLVTAGQETLWYAVYACALWAVVAMVVMLYGKSLVRRPA